MIFGNKDILAVYGFLQSYFRMVTNLNNYVTFDDDDDVGDFRYNYRENMIAQFKQDLCNESFRHQDEREDGLQKQLKFGFNMLLIREDQYVKVFTITIMAILEFGISFENQSTIQSLEKQKKS